MTDCPPIRHGQGHVSNFYILDLENFATASHQCIGAVSKLIDGQMVDYTYNGRARHRWMHKFIIYIHWSTTVTL